jgi:hypothetical protein
MYNVLAYQSTGNLGDAIQTLAIGRLLKGSLEGIYRNQIHTMTEFTPSFVVNGWLGDTTNSSSNCLFAGIHLGNNVSQQLSWTRKSKYKIGARDPYTYKILQNDNQESAIVGCATLTLPFYRGARTGVYSIDAVCGKYNEAIKLTNAIKPMPWHDQYIQALDRLKLLAQAELVITSRLHIVLPCLAFGTPVYFPKHSLKGIYQAGRLSLLDHLGFEYDTEYTSDISEAADTYKKFLQNELCSLNEMCANIDHVDELQCVPIHIRA